MGNVGGNLIIELVQEFVAARLYKVGQWFGDEEWSLRGSGGAHRSFNLFDLEDNVPDGSQKIVTRACTP